jgi:hypothetical protein
VKKTRLHSQIFLNEVEAGRVVEVQIQGNNINGTLADGKTFKTYSPNYPELVDKLSSKGVSIIATPREDKMPSLLGNPTFLVSNAFTDWCLDFFYASDARRKRWRNGLW